MVPVRRSFSLKILDTRFVLMRMLPEKFSIKEVLLIGHYTRKPLHRIRVQASHDFEVDTAYRGILNRVYSVLTSKLGI